MQRKWNPKVRSIKASGFGLDIRKNLEPEQTQNFAACCLAWNRIQNSINVAFCFAIGAPPRLRKPRRKIVI